MQFKSGLLLSVAFVPLEITAFQAPRPTVLPKDEIVTSGVGCRRDFLGSIAVIGAGFIAPSPSFAVQDTMDIDSFLRTGVDGGGPMGVSSQAGKSRPQTGVIFRDGSDVLQDKSGAVSAEILTRKKADPQAVLISFVSPWKLETGPVFDVECRDGKTGDGAFLAVTQSTEGKSLSQLPDSFFLSRLFDPTGRFSFYGSPTDIKVRSSKTEGDKRYMEVNFSGLSQSTNAEIPRKAYLVATIPKGSDNAVMLVGSSTASRWKKGSEESIRKTVDSFSAAPAPKTSMKIRAKQRGDLIEF